MNFIPNGEPCESGRQRLKVGVLVDDWFIPAWAYRALERTKRTGLVDFALVLLNDSTAGGSGAAKAGNRGRNPVFTLYDAVDRKVFCRKSQALQQKDLRILLPGTPGIRIAPAANRHESSLRPGIVERIRETELDLLVQLGFGVLRGPILNSARHGVWAFHHAEPGTRGGNPPGFWEAARRQMETGAILLQLMGEPPGGQILQRLKFPTYPLSAALNQEYCLWASSSLLARQIELISRTRNACMDHEVDPGEQQKATFRPLPCPNPSAIQTLRAASRVFGRNLRRIPKKALCPDQWILLYDLNDTPPESLQSYQKLVPPADRFWADPHVVGDGPSYYVFFEDYCYQTRKGHISVVEIGSDGHVKSPIPVLEEPYHLSYPCVFQWSGKYYMVPESADNRTVDLYECVSFPHRWQKKMTLMEPVRAVDTTLFRHNGKWWMFTAMAENEEAFPNVELFIFWSDELLSRHWKPHARNPIVSDGTRARPAGAIFLEGGRIYRPSQDSSGGYGYGFDLNEITVLSETEYSERTLTSIRPGWDGLAKATHTFARAGRLTVVDALYTRWRWSRKLA